jgi:hypothetical protein
MNTIPECSANAKILAGLLEKVRVGEVITYAEMSDAIHEDVVRKRHYITTARNLVRRKIGAIFGAISKVGLRRLDDAGIAATLEGDKRGISRRCTRSIRKSEHIDMSKLDQTQRTMTTINVAVLQAIKHAASGGNARKLAAKATPEPKAIDALAKASVEALK